MENYLTYPCEVMRITQRYDGRTSHKAHMTGTPRDYSLDEWIKDGGRDWIFCGCDALRVARITGTRNNKKTNSIWLTSTTPVDLANGKRTVATLQFIHPNDDDLLKIKEGQIFRRGDKIEFGLGEYADDLVERQLEAVRAFQDSGDVAEQDSLLGEIPNRFHVAFECFHMFTSERIWRQKVRRARTLSSGCA